MLHILMHSIYGGNILNEFYIGMVRHNNLSLCITFPECRSPSVQMQALYI